MRAAAAPEPLGNNGPHDVATREAVEYGIGRIHHFEAYGYKWFGSDAVYMTWDGDAHWGVR